MPPRKRVATRGPAVDPARPVKRTRVAAAPGQGNSAPSGSGTVEQRKALQAHVRSWSHGSVKRDAMIQVLRNIGVTVDGKQKKENLRQGLVSALNANMNDEKRRKIARFVGFEKAPPTQLQQRPPEHATDVQQANNDIEKAIVETSKKLAITFVAAVVPEAKKEATNLTWRQQATKRGNFFRKNGTGKGKIDGYAGPVIDAAQFMLTPVMLQAMSVTNRFARILYKESINLIHNVYRLTRDARRNKDDPSWFLRNRRRVWSVTGRIVALVVIGGILLCYGSPLAITVKLLKYALSQLAGFFSTKVLDVYRYLTVQVIQDAQYVTVSKTKVFTIRAYLRQLIRVTWLTLKHPESPEGVKLYLQTIGVGAASIGAMVKRKKLWGSLKRGIGNIVGQKRSRENANHIQQLRNFAEGAKRARINRNTLLASQRKTVAEMYQYIVQAFANKGENLPEELRNVNVRKLNLAELNELKTFMFGTTGS